MNPPSTLMTWPVNALVLGPSFESISSLPGLASGAGVAETGKPAAALVADAGSALNYYFGCGTMRR